MDGSSSISPHSLVTLIGSQASPIIIMSVARVLLTQMTG